jgi:glycogen synthase
MASRKLIWIFCFEYAGVAKVGGLGEVSANQTENLIAEPELDLHVFMPGHGKHLELQEKLHLAPLLEADGSKLILRGHFDPAYFGLDVANQMQRANYTKYQSFTDVGYFEIEVWKGDLKKVPIYLLVGANPIAATILNDSDVYGPATLNAKLALFAHGMREFIRWCIFKEPARIPDIIHIHDHHPVGALLNCRQELNFANRDVRSIITMHLLSWPRRDIEFYWKSHVNNEPMLVQIGTYRIWRRFQEIYDLCQGGSIEAPTIEQIGCAIADRVIAVSETFLQTDIIPYCGKDVIRWKSDFTWNGCDWNFEANRRSVYEKYKTQLPNLPLASLRSWDFRKMFLTQILGRFPPGEPKFPTENIRAIVSEEYNAPPYYSNCTTDPFTSDGPMVLITGRVSPQKGVEYIFDALPYVISQIPSVKFVFLMVPSAYSMDDLRAYMKVARQYPENVRFIFGVAGSIYLLAYLAADVYCCPSRWEPFGIVALEAMASKVPVVATYVGGLQESILHLEDHRQDGTGLLCPANDFEALKYALVSLLATMQCAELVNTGVHPNSPLLSELQKMIVHPVLRSQVVADPKFGDQIRTNAYDRVENVFRWRTVSQKLKQIYLSLNY